MKLIVYSPEITPRLEYTAEILFQRLLKAGYILTSHRETFLSSHLPRINYSQNRLSEQEVFLPAGKLLFERGAREIPVGMTKVNGLPAFFQSTRPGCDVPFDLLALVFFLVSRYEEYLPFARDVHGRFRAEESIAFREGFLDKPLVDLWARQLRRLILDRYPRFEFPKTSYSFQPTFDVDLAWAYRHRPWWLTVASSLRDLTMGDLPRLRERIAVLQRRAEDPFFTFPYLRELHSRYEQTPIFFFLLGNFGGYDRNVDYHNPELQQLIRQTAKGCPVAIHPSYRSNEKNGRLEEEIRRFNAITGTEARRSRQHFLKLELPGTYRRLIRAGIQEDYTMGYASHIGFRASTATPFPWYDLDNEKATGLMVFPFQAMDVTLKKYLGLSAQEALSKLRLLIQATREVDGTFCTIWHNSSFSKIDGWAEWKQVYEALVEEAGQS